MRNNRLINEIDREYKPLFKKVIISVLNKHSFLPIEWEDIYYEFLYEIPKIHSEYDESKDLAIHTYYSLKLRFFAFNKCRHFSGMKYKYLNEAKLIEGDHIDSLSDSDTQASLVFDICSLSDLELVIYEHHVMECRSIRSIAIERGIKYWDARNALQTLKTKMLNQI